MSTAGLKDIVDPNIDHSFECVFSSLSFGCSPMTVGSLFS